MALDSIYAVVQKFKNKLLNINYRSRIIMYYIIFELVLVGWLIYMPVHDLLKSADWELRSTMLQSLQKCASLISRSWQSWLSGY